MRCKPIIAVVQNDKEQALTLATRAVELDQASSTARLALSYAQQAHFNIEEALKASKKRWSLTHRMLWPGRGWPNCTCRRVIWTAR